MENVTQSSSSAHNIGSDHRAGKESLLTLDQAAKAFRLSRRRLREEIRAGRLTCMRVGRRLFIEISEVERFIVRYKPEIPLPSHSLIWLLFWVLTHRGDGDLSGMTVAEIEAAARWNGPAGYFVALLCETGRLSVRGGHFYFPLGNTAEEVQ